ncbi:hypothetical protein AU074_13390 [Pseudomonas sp. ATCC PTA-122608]|jgi:hypothetical protein|uniref:hypothetical protein n=1 Tax=unclassified Pseudomonas TaxID=196821 RepID=UPI00096BCB17|nr:MULTISPECIES: hypothetical protein [unclassified Pseudomonas]NIL18776.1 hypothetical protein [Pseudomonas sp. AN3A02]OLY72165.1 hypothetical protein AU074_13390 [Pseudomonas sp. ATCC PTA-122608]
MKKSNYAPAITSNTTGLFKATVSHRGDFLAQELEYQADEHWFGITAIAQKYSAQSERRFEMVLHRDIQSGTYDFEEVSVGPVVRVIYSNMELDGFGFMHRHTVTKQGTLKLKISENNNHYSGTLDMTVEARDGETLRIAATFDVWLVIVLR